MDDSDLIQGLYDGEERAMTAFVERYRPALERIADGAIAPGLRNRISGDSVAQSVCRSFLRRMDADPYELQDADALWRLLCAIALTKVREQVRFHRRERRSTEREVPLEGAGDVPARSIPADEVVAFEEELQYVLAKMDDEERRILELRLSGKTQGEIATEMQCSERTVRRLLSGLDQKLRGWFGR